MKKIFFIILVTLFTAQNLYGANTGKEINSKCRSNLRLLNKATTDMLKSKVFDLPQWESYKQASNSFLSADKYLDGKKILGPTLDCEYFLVSLNNNDFQWYCNLHGVLEGEKTISFRYHEHQLQGKSSDKYMVNDNYKKHVQSMLQWTEYTPTPLEVFKYHYNMNPIMTTILGILFVIGTFIGARSFFRL